MNFKMIPCNIAGVDVTIPVNMDQIKYVTPSPMNGATCFMYFGQDTDSPSAWVQVNMPLSNFMNMLTR